MMNTCGIPNVPRSCLITGTIPDPRKKKNKNRKNTSLEVDGFHALDNQTEGAEAQMTLQWFSKIKLSPEYQKLLSYMESCLIISEDGQGIGKMYTSVEISSWAGVPCLLVHSGSYAKIRPDVDVGTSLTGFLSPELRVIQELAHEWCNFKGVKFDRKTFLMEEAFGTSLHCRSTLKRDDVTKYDRVSSIPFIDLKTFMSESANILFQRLIILERRKGIINLRSMSPLGSTTPVQYRVLGQGVENVKGDKTTVFGIRRSVWNDIKVTNVNVKGETNNDKKAPVNCEALKITTMQNVPNDMKKTIQSWDSIFNLYGRLVLRCQPEDNNHAMIPLWFSPVDEYDEFGQYAGMKPPIIWACDEELYSNYLMKKTELAAQYKTYLMDHPALHTLLSDFLKKLFFTKPKDVFQFAKDFFTPLLKLDEDSPENSDCDTSTCVEDEEYKENPGEVEEIMQNIIELHRKIFPMAFGEDGEETDVTEDGSLSLSTVSKIPVFKEGWVG